MTETDLHLEATIRVYFDLHKPAIMPAPLLIAAHGYGAHKRYMMKEAKLVTPEHFAVASVQGPHQHFRQTDNGYRVGFGWLTDHRPDESVRLHHDFMNDLIDRLAGEGVVDPEQVFLYGFSQACALNFRYAFTFPERIRAAVGVCGGIPGDLDTNPVYTERLDADVLYLYGDNDEFYSLERFREFDRRLGDRIAKYRSTEFAAKHEITDEMRSEVARFLLDNSA